MTIYSMSWRQLGIAALAAIGMTFCLPAAAQSDADEGEKADDEPLVEEIVVTATYRDTNLMDTPVTISALTDIELEQRGVEDITSLFLAIPGLNYGNATNTWHRVVARGIAQFRAPTSPVSIYVDNVPVTGTSSRQPRLPNFDLERIEVLKGPQGTLYGEGSMAGAIRYITKKPNPAGFDWAFTTRISDPSHSGDMGLRIDSMINIPLGERLAARITPYARNKAGILDKVGPEIIEDVDEIDERGVRAQLAFYPTDKLTLNATYYYVESDIGGPGIAFHCFSEERPAGGNFPRGDALPQVPQYPVIGGCETGENGTFDGETQRYKDGPSHVYVTHMASPQLKDGGISETAIINLSAEWELPWADLMAASGFYEHDITFAEEQSVGGAFGTIEGGLWDIRTDAACATVGCGTGGFWGRSSVRSHSSLNERWATEARLVSNTDSRLEWSVGVYIQRIDLDADPRLWEPCGSMGVASGTAYANTATGVSAVTENGDPVVCTGGFTFNPEVMSLEQMRQVHNLLQGVGRRGGASYQDRDSEAIFGEVGYRISDQFHILAGVRYAESTVELLSGPGGMWVPQSETNPRAEPATQDKAAPKVTLSWRPNDDTMVYLTYAEAFRTGGINTRLVSRLDDYEDAVARGVPGAAELAEAASQLLNFEGDDIESWELGVKATVLDGRLDIMASVYDTAINNAVVRTGTNFPALPDPDNPLLTTPYSPDVNANIGKAASRGLEFELRGKLTDSLRLHAGGAYVPDAETQTQQSGGEIAGAGVRVNIDAGNRISFTPVHAYFASLMYDFELAGFDATLRGDYYYRGTKLFRSENNERPTPTNRILNLKLLLARDNYEVGVFIQNVADDINPFTLGSSGYNGFNPPRTLGLQFSLSQ